MVLPFVSNKNSCLIKTFFYKMNTIYIRGVILTQDFDTGCSLVLYRLDEPNGDSHYETASYHDDVDYHWRPATMSGTNLLFDTLKKKCSELNIVSEEFDNIIRVIAHGASYELYI